MIVNPDLSPVLWIERYTYNYGSELIGDVAKVTPASKVTPSYGTENMMFSHYIAFLTKWVFIISYSYKVW